MSVPFGYFPPALCTGLKGYPPQWHESIKHAVRDAAGNRCVRCHHPYEKGAGEWSRCDEQCTHRGPYRWRLGEGYPWTRVAEGREHDRVIGEGIAKCVLVEAQWRILTVHHLDGDKGNCRWFNLAALCQRCHLVIQGKVVMDRSWHHEHSEWFRPYAAGFYAWWFLGEDLTRPEVDARLNELLALESRQLALDHEQTPGRTTATGVQTHEGDTS